MYDKGRGRNFLMNWIQGVRKIKVKDAGKVVSEPQEDCVAIK